MTAVCFKGQHYSCPGCNCTCHARSLFNDPLPPHQRHSDTSLAAAVAIMDDLGPLEVEVRDYIRGAGDDGVTDEEGYTALNMNPSTYRPRRIDLVNKYGQVKDSGRRRRTRSGRQAVVWVAA